MNPHGFSLSAAGLRSIVRLSRSRMRSPGEMVRTPQIVGRGIADEGASLGDLEPTSEISVRGSESTSAPLSKCCSAGRLK